ncbi:Alpha/Beta hydrolase protein [Apiospora rasikravindrae]|uniref:Alpha/Beta hydrolase protein n=1 Tax=Apiospora rasikravindrae TaxID=990691 RepID=A0ABR1RS02_9PEZI
MSQYGLVQVHCGDDAEVDIVFLHGLRGSMEGTWSKTGILWPRDILPKDVPKSRIYLFGYDSGITHRDQSSVVKTEIHSDADDLCARFEAERSSTDTPPDRPIIFVAHSLGGLVAAQILVHGVQNHDGSGAHLISKNLRGLIFLSTPFRGSKVAKPAEIARRILEACGVDTQQDTLKLLGVNSKPLEELTDAFTNVLGKRRSSKNPSDAIEACFFFETKKTRVGSGHIQVVERESAQLKGLGDAVPIRADHHEICKFETDKDEGYQVVVAAMRKAMISSIADSDEVRIHLPMSFKAL